MQLYGSRPLGYRRWTSLPSNSSWPERSWRVEDLGGLGGLGDLGGLEVDARSREEEVAAMMNVIAVLGVVVVVLTLLVTLAVAHKAVGCLRARPEGAGCLRAPRPRACGCQGAEKDGLLAQKDSPVQIV